ncbi:MAG: dNTP triphosphohydrolase, broad substrate specificity [uncultured Paraburkholderia sp.]|nr:MAG: dNTP triphosphohydrolase, broad substrate specificity [uncultured Paraburkholderia sp.]CAH2921313.1 MAG: dNTP triphosphohydrolase, broad substrate specificity [uncultured Paraburkholderia sp.]
MEVELWQVHYEAARADYPKIEGHRLIHETVRRIINTLIVDLIEITQHNLIERAPDSLDAVRAAPVLVAHSGTVAAQAATLKRFLFKNLYRHYRVMRMANKARRVIMGLFDAFTEDPRLCLLLPSYQSADADAQPRLIAHYIAGMTDRYAVKEYQRLFIINDN